MTEGRPIPDQSAGMSTDGAPVARHGVRRTTDVQARGGGPDPESLTPPQLTNFNIDDFAVVSHTMDSFTFTSAHPFFPGWVRVVSAHREDWVRNVPCNHNQEEEQRDRRRVRRDVEPPEVRRFLRQELLKKVDHSWFATTGTTSGSRWEGRLNHSSRLNREPAAKQILPG